ncbi:MAG: hypothetical protein Q8P50_09050 [Bacillota bacterium]|nr:hypothetical protein [Bacillota bacterium]
MLRAASGHAAGLLRLDKERLVTLRLLGEYYHLWGPGRRVRPEGVGTAQPQPFCIVGDPEDGT